METACLEKQLPHNGSVLKSRPLLLCLLVGLAGCSTASRQASERAPDWDHAEGDSFPIETVSESPTVTLPHDTEREVMADAIPITSPWISLVRWARENQAGRVTRLSGTAADSFALHSPAGVLEIQTRNQAATWNGVALRLGYPPQLINGQPFVHFLDLTKNILPLLTPVPQRNVRTVVIDPGHGGSSGGTQSVLDGSEEKLFTLDWALRLESILTNSGWKVYLTRTNDSEVALPARVAFADQNRAGLFISLHFNSAAPSRHQSGLETFCTTPTGMPSTLTREFEDDMTLVFPNNAYDAENLRLAMSLQRRLLQTGGFVDRGVKRARFLTVLRGQNRPAVLIEAGFLSNPDEARRIADPAFRQSLAEAVAAVLMESWDNSEFGRPKPAPWSSPSISSEPNGMTDPTVPRASQP